MTRPARALGPAGRPLRRRRHRRLAGLGGPQRRRRRLRRRATRDDAGLAVRQVVGERFLAAVAAVADGATACSTRSSATTTASSCVYAAADLLVGRGGASTVAEVAVTGTPAILVPWAGAAEDHQTLNVRWLADQGAAPCCSPRPSSARLGDAIDGLRGRSGRGSPRSAQRARRAGRAAPRRRPRRA